MASTYSTNLAIELIGTGDQAGTWGTTTNSNLGTLIEQAISGYVTQAVSTGTDTTITIPNGSTGVARNMYIELTGTGGTNTNLIVPANKKLYFIFNNSTGAVTVKVSGQTGVSVPTGKKMVLVSNGTDIVNGLNYIADFGTNSFTVTNLTASSGTITNLIATTASISDASATVFRSASATITNLLGTTLTISGNTFLATSSGNVGIGTTSPGSKLDLVGVLQWQATAGTVLGKLTYAGGEPTVLANTGLGLNFYTNNAFAAKIDSSGNLIVGGTSPVISGAGRGNITINGSSSAIMALSVGGSAKGWVYHDNTNLEINAGTTGAMIMYTASTERMRLTSSVLSTDSSISVGIGTASPTEKLTVSGNATVTGSGRFQSGGSNWMEFATNVLTSNQNDGAHIRSVISAEATPTYSFKGDEDTGIFHPGANILAFTTGGTTKATLDSSGNLGLGVTPSAWANNWKALQVGAGFSSFVGRSDAFALYIGQNWLHDGTDKYIGNAAASIYSQNGGIHAWYNAPSGTAGNPISFTQAMTLSAAGGLTVGSTSDPGAGKILAEGSSASHYVASSKAGITTTYLITDGSGANVQVDGAWPIRFTTNSTERARITSGGDFGIGTSSPGARLSVTNSNATSPTAEFGGNQVREFVRTGTQSSDTTIRVDIAFTSQGSNWSSQLIEIAVSTSAGGSSSRYGGVVRYVLTSLTDLQGPTALASDLTGLTVATAFSGMEFRVTFTTTAGNIDLYCVHVRVLSSNTSAPATSVVIS